MKAERQIGLDVIRTLAIIMVVWSHFYTIIESNLNDFFIFLSASAGDLGVLIFFVLSGFLVGRIFLRDIALKQEYSKRQILNFWIRRWFRTLPNYYLFLIIYLILFYLRSENIISSENPTFFSSEQISFYKYFFFIQNFFEECPYFFGQTWSLSVEEWFYLLLPLPFIIFHLVFGKSIKFIGYNLICIFLVFQFIKLFTFVYEPSFYHKSKVIFNLDSILLGVILAYYYLIDPIGVNLKKKQLFLSAIIGIVLLNGARFWVIDNPSNSIFALTRVLNSIFFTLCIPYFIGLRWKGMGAKIVEIISLSSYTLYLSHILFQIFFVGNYLLPLFPNKEDWMRFLIFPVYLALNVIFSYLHYKYFEVPFMNFRDRNSFKKLLFASQKLI